MRTLISFTLFILIFLPPAVQADIYRWQDNSGSWHITDDPSTIPSRYRDQVKKEVLPEQPEEEPPPVEEDLPVQIPEGDEETAEAEEEEAATDAEEDSDEKSPETDTGPKTYKIEYTETEDSLELDVILNEKHTFTFMLDTGASYIILSREVAEELGYDPDEIMARVYVSTANGVITSRLVRIPTVQVGDAVVHNVKALVQEEENMGVKGLLGLSFLNEFDWSNDTMEEVLTLKEFTNKPEDEVYGGHNEKWWKKKFKDAKKQINEIQENLQELEDLKFKIVSRNSTRDWYVKIEEANLEFYKEELSLLDRKANQYAVPRSWR
jgi:clan AA aspartic protease (TIGR02281 family)